MWLLWGCLLVILSIAQSNDDHDPLTIVKTNLGLVHGRRVVTERNTTAYVFLGVPYAEPPIGPLRYRLPMQKKPWTDTIDAQQYKFSCLWNTSVTSNLVEYRKMSEDCLHANIFTNENCLREKNCAVMYYVHGGGFNFDSPMLFPINYVVDNFNTHHRNVIMVTIAYRLGSFGFLNIPQTSAIQNLGLHAFVPFGHHNNNHQFVSDMMEGLRWIQREILAFGGDKNKVTLIGHSSGSVNVDQLAVSPLTDGLFAQLSVMSGPGGLNPLKKDINVEHSKALAIRSKCATNETWAAGDFEPIIECMRGLDAFDLLSIQRILEDVDHLTFQGPTIDGENGILPSDFAELVKNRRPYPFLIGTVSKEFRATQFLVGKGGKVNKKLLTSLCKLLVGPIGGKSIDVKAATKACTTEYETSERSVDMLDDILIYIPTYESANYMRLNNGPTFVYSFEYDEVGNAYYVGFDNPKELTPHHTEELTYLMGIHKGNFTQADEKVRDIFSQLFVNFANNADPSPTTDQRWEPMTDRNNYFIVDFDEDFNMPGNADGYHQSAIDFWQKTLPSIKANDKSNKDDDDDDGDDLQDLIDRFRKIADNISIDDIWNKLANGSQKPRNLEDDQQNRMGFRQLMQQRPMRLPVLDVNNASMNTTTIDPYTTATVQEESMVFFWIAIGVIVTLVVVLIITCSCYCYNRSKRLQYERIA